MAFYSFIVDFNKKLSRLKIANAEQTKPTHCNTVTSYFHIYNNIVFHKILRFHRRTKSKPKLNNIWRAKGNNIDECCVTAQTP